MILPKGCSHSDHYLRPKLFRFEHYPARFEYLDTVDVLDNGVSVKRVQYKMDNSEKRFAGLTASDFELSNLLAAGADLKFCQCVPTSIDMVDGFKRSSLAMFNVIAKIKAENS